jgi:hypothetical protein
MGAIDSTPRSGGKFLAAIAAVKQRLAGLTIGSSDRNVTLLK